MNLRGRLFERFAEWIIGLVLFRSPDFIIGGREDPYMLRWWITPWSRVGRGLSESEMTRWQWFVSRMPGVYLHLIARSDDDRALHDHPWANCSLLLRGWYVEHTIAAGGIHRQQRRQSGSLTFRRAKAAHRLEIDPDAGVCWSLFAHGLRLHHWGFHCPQKGWVPWRKFVASDDAGAIGRGCD